MMKRIFIALVSTIFTCSIYAQMNISIVDRPTKEATNSNYVSFREPLQQVPLIKLPVGQVQPKGWLRKYLKLQQTGLNGKLGTISAWLDKNNNQWLSNQGDHGWEEVPYWLRGYISLAYILDVRSMKTEAGTWIKAVLNNQNSNGMLGPDGYDGNSPDLWAKMPMLWALQTYYEGTGDESALTALENHFKWELAIPENIFLNGAWQDKRGGDNLWSVLWTYNRTGNKDILPLAEKLHRNTSDWTMKGTLPNWHGVNIAQGFREPATYYLYSGDEAMLQATYDNQMEMRKRYGQMPGGMYAADENARHGYYDPRNGAETCAIVEQMASDEILMGITGDPFWADHCENVALNTFTAALTPDMKALRYITSANMAISDEKLHGPSIDNNLRGMLSMTPFSSRCCQHNHGMGWPYYSEHLVMATADNGLATMLYAANETTAMVGNRHSVKLTEDTQYPFNDKVTLTINTEGNVVFPLYLRIPEWSTNTMVEINGESVDVKASTGKYVRIEREWTDGDVVTLTMPMSITTQLWQANKSSVSVNYGPLTLSLLIDEIWEEHDSRDHDFVQDDSHWQEGVNAALWPSYAIKPGSEWNYGLVLDKDMMPIDISVEKREYPSNDQPFTPENVPLVFKAKGRQIPSWGYDATGMTDLLPTKYEPASEETKTISLIPMGATRLRISAFPRLKE